MKYERLLFYLFVPWPKQLSLIVLRYVKLSLIRVMLRLVFLLLQNDELRQLIKRRQKSHLEMAVLNYHKVKPASNCDIRNELRDSTKKR